MRQPGQHLREKDRQSSSKPRNSVIFLQGSVLFAIQDDSSSTVNVSCWFFLFKLLDSRNGSRHGNNTNNNDTTTASKYRTAESAYSTERQEQTLGGGGGHVLMS